MSFSGLCSHAQHSVPEPDEPDEPGPELTNLFEQGLGNLPLSVTLCGTILRFVTDSTSSTSSVTGSSSSSEADPTSSSLGEDSNRLSAGDDLTSKTGGDSTSSVADPADSASSAGLQGRGAIKAFIELFNAVKVDKVDTSGFSSEQTTHYLGLVRAVLATIERLLASSAFASAAEKDDVRRLLACLSMLPHTSVPERMLVCHNAAVTTQGVFETPTRLWRAEAMLVNCGLVRGGLGGNRGNSRSSHADASSSGIADAYTVVGTMHQMVARCVREHHTCTERGGAVAAGAVTSLRQELARQVNAYAHDDRIITGKPKSRVPLLASGTRTDVLVACCEHWYATTSHAYVWPGIPALGWQ